MPDKHLYVIAQFDEEASEKIKDIERRLNHAGLFGTQTKNIPYHITLGTFDPEHEPETARRLESICGRFERFNLSFSHIGLFGLNVLFLAPDVNHDLLNLRRLVCESSKQDQGWTPHATILIDEPKKILKALPIVTKHFKSIDARVESLGLYEFWPTRFVGEYKLK